MSVKPSGPTPTPPPLRNAPPRPSLLSRLRPRTRRDWLLSLSATAIVLLVFAWMLSRMTPSWYRPLDPTDVRVIDAADNAQKRALELHNVIGRVPLGEQRWAISQDEVNSFMAIRFAPPLNPDGSRTGDSAAVPLPTSPGKTPPVVSGPVVAFTPGKVTVSAHTTRIPGPDPAGGVGSLVFTVGIVNASDGKPMGLVKLTGVWIGRLPVPKSVVQSRLHAMVPSIAAAAQQAIQLNLNIRDASNINPYIEEIIRSVGEGRPFPLEYTVEKKRIVIKELRVDQGLFTVVLAPPTPAAVMPRPR